MAAEQKLKCLSIRQPFSWAVCVGEKTAENKEKKTSHRGLLLIHAGKAKDDLGSLKKLPGWTEYRDWFALGAIIGAVDLYDCIEFNTSLEANPHASGPQCYLLRNPRLFGEPIPCTGQLGIFSLPGELTARVETQLGRPGRTVQIPEDLRNEIRPSQSRVCYHQGEHYAANESFEDAIRRLDESIKLDASNSRAYF